MDINYYLNYSRTRQYIEWMRFIRGVSNFADLTVFVFIYMI